MQKRPRIKKQRNCSPNFTVRTISAFMQDGVTVAKAIEFKNKCACRMYVFSLSLLCVVYFESGRCCQSPALRLCALLRQDNLGAALIKQASTAMLSKRAVFLVADYSLERLHQRPTMLPVMAPQPLLCWQGQFSVPRLTPGTRPQNFHGMKWPAPDPAPVQADLGISWIEHDRARCVISTVLRSATANLVAEDCSDAGTPLQLHRNSALPPTMRSPRNTPTCC